MNQAIIDQIKIAQGIVLGAHTNPDGDAVGALVGMASLCRFLQVPYQILLEKIPTAFENLLEGIVVSEEATIPFDTFICVDCGDTRRLGHYESLFHEAQTTINIDHHATNQGFGTLDLVKTHAAASCEIVYEIIKAAGCPIDADLARALYTGLLTDTGGFMHTSTTSHTLRVVADLLEVSFDFNQIYYKQLYEQTEVALLMEGVAINHLEKLAQKPFYMTYVTQEEMIAKGAKQEDLGAIVSQIKNIQGCEVAAFLYPLDEAHIKVSFRSNAPYDVAALASQIGGGGHVRAAGATLTASMQEAQQIIKMMLEKC